MNSRPGSALVALALLSMASDSVAQISRCLLGVQDSRLRPVEHRLYPWRAAPLSPTSRPRTLVLSIGVPSPPLPFRIDDVHLLGLPYRIADERWQLVEDDGGALRVVPPARMEGSVWTLQGSDDSGRESELTLAFGPAAAAHLDEFHQRYRPWRMDHHGMVDPADWPVSAKDTKLVDVLIASLSSDDLDEDGSYDLVARVLTRHQVKDQTEVVELKARETAILWGNRRRQPTLLPLPSSGIDDWPLLQFLTGRHNRRRPLLIATSACCDGVRFHVFEIRPRSVALMDSYGGEARLCISASLITGGKAGPKLHVQEVDDGQAP